MTNSNLKTFDNFYADLAQSAYLGRPVRFPYESQLKDIRKLLDNGDSLEFVSLKILRFITRIKKNGKSLPAGNIFPIMVRSTCSQILIYILWKIR